MPTLYCQSCGSPSFYTIGGKPSKCGSCKSSFTTSPSPTKATSKKKVRVSAKALKRNSLKKKLVVKEIADDDGFYDDDEEFDGSDDLDQIAANLSSNKMQGVVFSGGSNARVGSLGDLVGDSKPEKTKKKKVSKAHIKKVKESLGGLTGE